MKPTSKRCSPLRFAHLRARGVRRGLPCHVTVRDPLLKDPFRVNPHGLHFFESGRCSDLVSSTVRVGGNRIVGSEHIAYQVHSRHPSGTTGFYRGGGYSHDLLPRILRTMGSMLPAD